MPSKSRSQQRLFGMALSVKRGETTLSELTTDKDLRKKIKDIIDGMSEKDIEKYAKTDHDGLPEKVAELATLGSVVGQSADSFYYGSGKPRKLSKKEKEMLRKTKELSGEILPTFKDFMKMNKDKDK